jgi:hypothetical protein
MSVAAEADEVRWVPERGVVGVANGSRRSQPSELVRNVGPTTGGGTSGGAGGE